MDSAAYLAEGRYFLEGSGFAVPSGVHAVYGQPAVEQRELVVMNHFPPLLPAVVAATGVVDDPASHGRWLNALLLVATVLIASAMIARHTGRRALGCGGGTALAVSPTLLGVHLWLWSEALFLPLALLGLWALSSFLERPSERLLLASAFAFSLAWLTRHSGAALVAAGLLALLARGPRHRLRDSVVFVAVAAAPMAAWASYGALTGIVSTWGLGLNAIDPEHLEQGLATVRRWFVGDTLGDRVENVVATLVLFLVFALVVLGLRTPAARRGTDRARFPGHGPFVVAVFVLVYVAFVAAAASLSQRGDDPRIQLDDRILAPVYVGVVVLAACAAGRLLDERGAWRRPAAVVGLVLIAALALWSGARGGALARAGGDEDSLRGRSSGGSHFARGVGQLPRGVRVYTNRPDRVYTETGRPSFLLPVQVSLEGEPNLRYRTELNRLRSEVGAGRTVVVYVVSNPVIEGLPLLHELHEVGMRTRRAADIWGGQDALLFDRTAKPSG